MTSSRTAASPLTTRLSLHAEIPPGNAPASGTSPREKQRKIAGEVTRNDNSERYITPFEPDTRRISGNGASRVQPHSSSSPEGTALAGAAVDNMEEEGSTSAANHGRVVVGAGRRRRAQACTLKGVRSRAHETRGKGEREEMMSAYVTGRHTRPTAAKRVATHTGVPPLSFPHRATHTVYYGRSLDGLHK